MLETIIFLALVALCVKFWKEILGIITIVLISILAIIIYFVMLPLKIIVNLISLPIYLFYSPIELNERKVISLYDKIFYKDKTLTDVKMHMRIIDSYIKDTKARKQKKENKEIVKFLNESKWVL